MLLNFFKRPADFLIASSEGLTKLATFFVIPVSGLFLITADFNLWSIIFPSIQILSSALTFGLPNYLLRSYYVKDTNGGVDNGPVYIAFLGLSLISALVFLGCKYLNPDNPFIRWDIYFILLTNSFLVIIQQKYQAEKNGIKYFNQSLFWRIGFAALIFILFVFQVPVGVDFLLSSLLLIQVILFVIAIAQECIPFDWRFDASHLKEIFRFGFPLFLMGLMQFIIYMNSRYFVYNLGIPKQTAIFSLIHTFAGTLNLLFVIFVRIYIPKLFEVLSGSKGLGYLMVYKKLLFALLEILSIIVIVGLFIYSELYKSGFESEIFVLAPLLLLGQFFYGFQLFVVDSLTYLKSTGKLFVISLSSAIFSLVVGYFLIQQLGIFGGALGIALSQLLSLCMVVSYCHPLFKSILGYKFCAIKITRIVIIFIASFLIYYLFGEMVDVIFMLILIGYLMWKLNIASTFKKFTEIK